MQVICRKSPPSLACAATHTCDVRWAGIDIRDFTATGVGGQSSPVMCWHHGRVEAREAYPPQEKRGTTSTHASWQPASPRRRVHLTLASQRPSNARASCYASRSGGIRGAKQDTPQAHVLSCHEIGYPSVTPVGASRTPTTSWPTGSMPVHSRRELGRPTGQVWKDRHQTTGARRSHLAQMCSMQPNGHATRTET